MDFLRGMETVKASGAESSGFAQWSGYYAKVVSGEQKLGATAQWLNALAGLDSLNFAIVCIGVSGSWTGCSPSAC